MGSGKIEHHADYTSFNKSIRFDSDSQSEPETKNEILQQLLDSYEALVADQTNWVCNLANCSSLIWHLYNDALGIPVNWSGFYILDGKDPSQLILGPFMGKVACQTIKIGHGVCGTAALSNETQLVSDVNLFPGHIACDGQTKSEIVVPFTDENGNVKGVLDLDSLVGSGFDEIDREYLQRLCTLVSTTCEW